MAKSAIERETAAARRFAENVRAEFDAAPAHIRHAAVDSAHDEAIKSDAERRDGIARFTLAWTVDDEARTRRDVIATLEYLADDVRREAEKLKNGGKPWASGRIVSRAATAEIAMARLAEVVDSLEKLRRMR